MELKGNVDAVDIVDKYFKNENIAKAILVSARYCLYLYQLIWVNRQ